MQLMLLGPPGSGKGTLAKDLAEIYAIPHISTGDIFRSMIKAKTPLGIKAETYINKGKLVPDELTIAMVDDRLRQEDCEKGFMLDGFPRTLPQAEALETLLASLGRPLSAVLNVLVSDELILYRLSGRRICSGCGRGFNVNTMPPKQPGICDDCGGRLVQRDDDKEETVRQRLSTYSEQTKPLIAFYEKRSLLVDVDNSGKPGENISDVKRDLAHKIAEGKRT